MRKILAGLPLALLLMAGCDDEEHHPPVAQDLALELDEDNHIEGLFPVTDEDGDPFSVEILQPPQHGVVTVSGPAFVYQPAPNYHGTDSFRYRARGKILRSDPADVSLAIRPVNDRPTTADITLQTPEEQVVTFTIPMNDVDGDSLTLVALGSSAGLVEVLDPRAGTARYTPNPDFNGAVSLQFNVHDGDPASYDDANANITVTPVNDAPVARNDLVLASHGNGQEWMTAAPVANDSDVDGDLLSIRSIDSTPAGQLTVQGGMITFTPAPEFLGSATVNYEIEDGGGATASAQITIEVRLVQSLLFVADREVPGRLELYRYDGMGIEKLNRPLNTNERLVDFKTVGRGIILYRTREGFTNHLYLRDLRAFAPLAERVSAHSVDEYYRVGLSHYYLSGNALYRASPGSPEAIYSAALPGESIQGVMEDRDDMNSLYLSTLQFNPALGSSSLKRLASAPPYDIDPPLVTAAGPDSIGLPLFTLPQGSASPALVHTAESAGARALYSVPVPDGSGPTRLSPPFGLNEFFSAVQPVPNRPYIVYRGNLGSNVSNIYRVDVAAPGVHTQVNTRTSNSQDLGGFAVSSSGSHVYYPLSNNSGGDRRVYVSDLATPGSGFPVSPSEPAAYGAHDVYVHPQNNQLVYLTQATPSGPSRLVLLDNPLTSPSVRNLRNAGTTLDQLRVPSGWRVAAVQERVGANALLLANLLAPGQVRTLHTPSAGGIGVTESKFEEF